MFHYYPKGLKTGMYYLRTKPAAAAIQFTVDKSMLKDVKEKDLLLAQAKAKVLKEKEQEKENLAGMTCSLQNKDDCLMCGS